MYPHGLLLQFIKPHPRLPTVRSEPAPNRGAQPHRSSPVWGLQIGISTRARLLATGGDRKTDAKDALHVAQVALFRHDLRPVAPEDQTTILRLLTERRDDLLHERTRVLNRLHAVLRDFLPGGARRRATPDDEQHI
ncbi:transposase [Streptomyces sp. NPDC102437]|uniref:IS110 family transposase n=1 Tax=Streptomyces sp. NPDC102437 TaxID=3366175 RepID=UPI00380FF65E